MRLNNDSYNYRFPKLVQHNYVAAASLEWSAAFNSTCLSRIIHSTEPGIGYVRTHIYIENMCTKKALSAWIPLVSVFCSSGAVSGIRGKQMTPAVASERSIFSKNHDYNTYIKSFPCRGGRKLRTDTHTHTRGTATVTMTIKIIRSTEAQ